MTIKSNKRTGLSTYKELRRYRRALESEAAKTEERIIVNFHDLSESLNPLNLFRSVNQDIKMVRSTFLDALSLGKGLFRKKKKKKKDLDE